MGCMDKFAKWGTSVWYSATHSHKVIFKEVKLNLLFQLLPLLLVKRSPATKPESRKDMTNKDSGI